MAMLRTISLTRRFWHSPLDIANQLCYHTGTREHRVLAREGLPLIALNPIIGTGGLVRDVGRESETAW